MNKAKGNKGISDLSNERKRSNDLIEDSNIINVRKQKYENQTRVHLMQQLDQAYNIIENFTNQTPPNAVEIQFREQQLVLI